MQMSIRKDESTSPKLLALHIDMKGAMWKRDSLLRIIRDAAADGYNALLWEVEDKVRWDTCPEVAHPEAMNKEEFREILAEAAALGLEPIPLLQSVGHAEYVLSREKYKVFRENPSACSCYCLSRYGVRDFLKAIIAEMLDTFGDGVRHFHLGGDEARDLGTCPLCAKQRPGDLYTAHLESLAGLLRSRGVKPACWSDMLLNGSMDAKLPADWTVWHWDYTIGTDGDKRAPWTGRLPELAANGNDIVFCCASQSWGDSPFLVDWNRHASNIAAAVAEVKTGDLAGLCVTSWSVRAAPKYLQRPLFLYAARMMADNQADAAALWRSCRDLFFGPDGEAAARLGENDPDFQYFDARDVKRHFDKSISVPLVPPPSHALADRIAAWRGRLSAIREKISAREGHPLLEGLLRAYERNDAWLGTLENYNRGLAFELPDSEETSAFYAEEETEASARISEEILTARFRGDGALSVTCTRDSHRYSAGEKAEFIIDAPERGTIARITFLRGYLPITDPYIVKTPAALSYSPGEPGFILCRAEVQLPDGSFGAPVDAGAAFAPEQISTSLPRPDDYDEFWKRAFEEQDRISPDFTDKDIGDGLRLISCRTVRDSRIYGFLRIPQRDGAVPLQVKVSGGDSVLFKDKMRKIAADPAFADKGFLFIHLPDFEPRESSGEDGWAFYENWLADNGAAGPSLIYIDCDKGPEERWYYRSILGSCRLLDYAAAQPGVDPARIFYRGASTGGGFGIFLAAFSKHIRAAICEVPNYGNAGGPSENRPSGEDDRGAHWQTSLYYDAAYCAPRITCPVFISCGFIDYYCTPETIYCIYNALHCRKTIFDKTENGHIDKPAGYEETLSVWLESVCGAKL